MRDGTESDPYILHYIPVRSKQSNTPSRRGFVLPRKSGECGIGIEIDHEVENLFFQTYRRIPAADGEPGSDPDVPPTINVRRNS